MNNHSQPMFLIKYNVSKMYGESFLNHLINVNVPVFTISLLEHRNFILYA